MIDCGEMSNIEGQTWFAQVCNRLSQFDDFGSFSLKDPLYQVLMVGTCSHLFTSQIDLGV